MARKTVRIEIPVKNPEKFSKLLNDIQKKHVLLGPSSPLNDIVGVDMLIYKATLTDADTERSQAADLHEQAESINQQAETKYGRAEGQNIETPGTLYNMVDRIKDHLLNKNHGNEEALSMFGFEVVVGTAKSPAKKTPA